MHSLCASFILDDLRPSTGKISEKRSTTELKDTNQYHQAHCQLDISFKYENKSSMAITKKELVKKKSLNRLTARTYPSKSDTVNSIGNHVAQDGWIRI